MSKMKAVLQVFVTKNDAKSMSYSARIFREVWVPGEVPESSVLDYAFARVEVTTRALGSNNETHSMTSWRSAVLPPKTWQEPLRPTRTSALPKRIFCVERKRKILNSNLGDFMPMRLPKGRRHLLSCHMEVFGFWEMTRTSLPKIQPASPFYRGWPAQVDGFGRIKSRS